jgi:hypothetical protein
MLEQLKQWDPLSQVVFIHDYLQLVFQENTLNVYNPYIIEDNNGEKYAQGEVGYADALVRFIGSSIDKVEYKEKGYLHLHFSPAGVFIVVLKPGVSHSPEAFAYDSTEGPIVEVNA